MVSFASPLFWQIHYLVTNLSKKNFKTNVAELNQVRRARGKAVRPIERGDQSVLMDPVVAACVGGKCY